MWSYGCHRHDLKEATDVDHLKPFVYLSNLSSGITSVLPFSGPLMCQGDGKRWFLTGVASFGHIGCGVPYKYGVYTRVVNHLQWISQVTGMDLPQPQVDYVPLIT